ncbi:hypothetical protein EMMF5_005505 [Cystobasidiomycetes sp. EMM_F5]
MFMSLSLLVWTSATLTGLAHASDPSAPSHKRDVIAENPQYAARSAIIARNPDPKAEEWVYSNESAAISFNVPAHCVPACDSYMQTTAQCSGPSETFKAKKYIGCMCSRSAFNEMVQCGECYPGVLTMTDNLIKQRQTVRIMQQSLDECQDEGFPLPDDVTASSLAAAITTGPLVQTSASSTAPPGSSSTMILVNGTSSDPAATSTSTTSTATSGAHRRLSAFSALSVTLALAVVLEI